MGKYFDSFPRIAYNLGSKQYSNFQNVTNIFFRIGVVRDILTNVSSYYEYLVKETDTPDILAFNVYGDSEAHWLILLTNQILDPQYDWPLNSRDFNNHIISKYGSVETAKTTYHHYEKVIIREDALSGTVTETRFIVNESALTDVSLTISNILGSFDTGQTVYVGDSLETSTFSGVISNYNSMTRVITLNNAFSGRMPNLGEIVVSDESGAIGTIIATTPESKYESYESLPEEQYVETFNINGRTVIQTTRRNAVSNYDYEVDLNEQRRSIKIIKPEYYTRIVNEFEALTENADAPFIRRLV